MALRSLVLAEIEAQPGIGIAELRERLAGVMTAKALHDRLSELRQRRLIEQTTYAHYAVTKPRATATLRVEQADGFIRPPSLSALMARR
jgi:predicted transcriptional regulator